MFSVYMETRPRVSGSVALELRVDRRCRNSITLEKLRLSSV